MSEPTPTPQARRILIVDDDTDNADSLAMLLRLLSHQVLTAYTGPGALAAAATFRPDIIFLDICMPKMNGYEVAQQLRGMPEAASAFLIALTGYVQAEDYHRSQKAGFNHHMLKPTDLANIKRFIADLPPVVSPDKTP
jgi:CheY-like chemotaxis protein